MVEKNDVFHFPALNCMCIKWPGIKTVVMFKKKCPSQFVWLRRKIIFVVKKELFQKCIINMGKIVTTNFEFTKYVLTSN